MYTEKEASAKKAKANHLMSSFPRYHQDIVDNPVQRHERDHLRRERFSWFSRGLYAFTILIMLTPLLLGTFEAHFQYWLEVSFTLLIFLNAVVIFAIEMRIMGSSADAMRREFQGKTWELLILTGVDTWRLILGKWIGVIRGHRRDILFLYLLRFVTFIWGMVFYYLRQDGFYMWRSDLSSTIFDIRLDVSVLPTVALIMAVYLMLEMMLVASLPMPLSLLRGSRKGATWGALGMRIFVPMALIAIGAFIFFELPYHLGMVDRWRIDYSPEVWTVLMSIAPILVDNGFLLSGAHLDLNAIMNDSAESGFYWSIFVTIQILGIGLYLLWTWMNLRLAKFLAFTMNVSAPGFEPKIKPKHPQHQKMEMATPATANPAPVRTVPKVKVYRCEVVRYDRENAQLHIAIYAQGETSPIETTQFTGVSYFTGMMRWRTTDFSITQGGNLESFANQHHIDYDRLTADSTLYEMQSMDSPVYVIATAVHKVDE